MPLRIHFDADDLARTTVAAEPDWLWELVLSLHVLQGRHTPINYVPWRQRARTLVASKDLRASVSSLTTLVPERGNFPDFLTPRTTGSLEAGLDELAATPTARIGGDLVNVFARREIPAWVRRLAANDRTERASLTHSLRAYHGSVLAPVSDVVESVVSADRAVRHHDLVSGGVQQLLAGMPGPMRWKSPVLEANYPSDRDIYLAGRGITLIPSYFCWGAPVTFIDPLLPPVLVYPATRDRAPRTPGNLSALLGQTRAHALAALRTPHSTSELAVRINTSIASASKHASVLRQAGLVNSVRHGNTVIHNLTRLGHHLLSRSRE